MRDCTKCSLPTMLYPNYSGETNGTTVGVYTLIHICVCWLIRLGTSIILRLDYGIYDGVSHRTYNFCTCFAVHVFAKHSSDELSFCSPTAGFQVDGASTAATTVELVIYVIWRKYLHGGFLSHRSIPKIIQDFPWKQPSILWATSMAETSILHRPPQRWGGRPSLLFRGDFCAPTGEKRTGWCPSSESLSWCKSKVTMVFVGDISIAIGWSPL